MLVLSRKEKQRLIIGDNVVVEVIRVSGGTVRLGIRAPSEVPIRREELAPLAPCSDANPVALACAPMA